MKARIARLVRRGGMVACLLALVGSSALSAQLAPEYQESDPNDGAALTTAPSTVSITFNEPLDDGSDLTVVNSCNKDVDGDNVSINLNEITVSLTEGHYSGKYTAKYSAVGVGGVTGTNEGEISFEVAEGHPCGRKPHDHDKDKDKDHDHDHDKDKDKDHDHDKDKDPGDHDKDHDKGHGNDHTDHDDGDHSGPSHSTNNNDHSSMDHSTSGGHNNHSPDGGQHANHSSKNGGKHANHNNDAPGQPVGDLAGPVLPELPADGQAALVALALCAVMGVIGGVFLRASAQ